MGQQRCFRYCSQANCAANMQFACEQQHCRYSSLTRTSFRAAISAIAHTTSALATSSAECCFIKQTEAEIRMTQTAISHFLTPVKYLSRSAADSTATANATCIDGKTPVFVSILYKNAVARVSILSLGKVSGLKF